MTPVPKFKVAITIKAFCLNHTLISRILQARKVATPGNFDFVDVDDGGGDDDDDDDESGGTTARSWRGSRPAGGNPSSRDTPARTTASASGGRRAS